MVYTEGVGCYTGLYVVTINDCEYTAEMDFVVARLARVECIYMKSLSAWIWHRVIWQIGTYKYKRFGGPINSYTLMMAAAFVYETLMRVRVMSHSRKP